MLAFLDNHSSRFCSIIFATPLQSKDATLRIIHKHSLSFAIPHQRAYVHCKLQYPSIPFTNDITSIATITYTLLYAILQHLCLPLVSSTVSSTATGYRICIYSIATITGSILIYSIATITTFSAHQFSNVLEKRVLQYPFVTLSPSTCYVSDRLLFCVHVHV